MPPVRNLQHGSPRRSRGVDDARQGKSMGKNITIGLLAAALAVSLGLFVGVRLDAQTGDHPPSVYAGIVLVDGEAAENGTIVQAQKGGYVCASTRTGRGLNNEVIDHHRYALQVSRSDCDGSIDFYVGGRYARSAPFNHDILNVMRLSVDAASPSCPKPPCSPPLPPDGEATPAPASQPATVEVRFEYSPGGRVGILSYRVDGGRWVPVPDVETGFFFFAPDPNGTITARGTVSLATVVR